MITQKELKELLSYDKDAGLFTKLYRSKNSSTSKGAGWINGQGYKYIMVLGETYSAHRLAWLYVYGELPEFQIDHINHDRSDNRIKNLRSVTHSENQRNRLIPSSNSSGIHGVSWNKFTKKWVSSITVNGKRIHIGS